MFDILIVDDYEPWRCFCAKALQGQPGLQVIGQATDGLEAVSAAQKLQPDLILLDIGIPFLNGIEAARRIREVSPNSRILCVSQQNSQDIVMEAFGAGATGYLIKSEGGRELVQAVRTVLKGERFISAGFHLDESVSSLGERNEVPKVVASVPPSRTESRRHRHEVIFYSDDRVFLDGLSRFIGTALKAGSGAIVVATESHREGLLQRLEAFGVNRSDAEGRYIERDVANTVSEFLTDAGRHVSEFRDLIETAKQAATAEHPRVALFGEGVDLLCSLGHFEAAMQAEKIAAQLVEKYDVDMLCGYSLSGFQGETEAPVVQQICREHTAVHPG